MTIENLDSAFLASLNTLPIQSLSSGEGAPGLERVVTDVISATASGMASVGSTYRLARFPVQAKIKGVRIDLTGLDSNATAGAVFDINVAFSDSPFDGTQPPLQSSIPKTAKDGSVTTVALYSTPNKLFGTISPANSGAAKTNQNVLFAGTLTGWSFGGRDIPLWDFFGFKNSQGSLQNPNGYFDLLLYLSTAASTAAAGSIAAAVSFVI